MINETGNTENTNFSDEARASTSEANGSRKGIVKELGKKSLEPLVSVLGKHKADFSPYVEALSKALRSGAEALRSDGAKEEERFIGQYFADGADWIGRCREKLSAQSPDQVMRFIEDEGRKHPAILFGASYFAGIILGRFGRHLGKTMMSSTDTIH